MIDCPRRYPLHLHSRKYEFLELKKLKNKQLKNSLKRLRNDFKNCSAEISCKKDIESIVFNIIPLDFFGSKKNKKLFICLVKKVLNHSKGEFVHISLLSRCYERNYEWCKTLDECKTIEKPDEFLEILRDVNLFLLEKCVKPLIRKHFFPVSRGKSYRIDLIPKCQWQSFRDKIFHEMVSKGHVKLKDKYANYIPRGALRILPKGCSNSLNYRPVICYYGKSETDENYKSICRIKGRLKQYVKEKRLYSVLYESWAEFVATSGLHMIYGIKADVKDSFGSINIHKLLWVIQELPKRVLTDADKNFLWNRIKKQYISFNNAKNNIVVRWCHGLLQGDRLSSILCELYYLVLIDQKLLKKCLTGIFFFHRTVDDYIFCSTKKENVKNFISVLKQGHVLNQDKMFSNLLNNSHVELPYCGYLFNLYTKEVCVEFNMENFFLKDKLKLWNDYLFNSPEDYLTNVMKFSSSNFYFSKVIFNTHYNNEETIVKMFFQSMIYLGMKFHYAFKELKQYHKEYCNNHSMVTKKILDIIRIYARKTIKIIEKYKGSLFHGCVNYEMLLTIGARGFILVFQNYSKNFKEIICLLKKMVFMKIPLFGDLDISFFKKIPPSMIVQSHK